MQCPECGSHYTQLVPLAHKQSIRIGQSGYQTISEFGLELEPPSAQSEFLAPIGLSLALMVLMYFFLPKTVSWTMFAWLNEYLSTFWGRVAISAGIALLILVRMSVSAATYNLTHYADDLKEWSKQVICRRCGAKFLG